jgi:hypothetical protein
MCGKVSTLLSTEGKESIMVSQELGVGVRVRVEHHRIAERRGMVGRVVGSYGGDDYLAVDVRFPDGRHRLFWPGDLEEISSPQPWWRSLLSRNNAE